MMPLVVPVPIRFPGTHWTLQEFMGYMAGVQGGGHRGRGARGYKNNFICYPAAMMPTASETKIGEIDLGGKLIMPMSALDQLTRQEIQYPMMFAVHNRQSGRSTHCGVLEFIADEGLVHMPHWMMQNLVLAEGDRITVENVQLPVATYARFKPQSTNFLDITNHKSVLERSLRSFSCLTEGDIIAISYNNKVYEILVEEVKPKGPAKAVSIVECDLELDFAEPVGYIQPQRVVPPIGGGGPAMPAYDPSAKVDAEIEKEENEVEAAVQTQVFQTYSGAGQQKRPLPFPLFLSIASS
jgi:hypothetical protein